VAVTTLRARGLARWFPAPLLALVIAGCASVATSPTAAVFEGSFEYWIQTAIRSATSGHASDEQIAILNEAANSGELSPALEEQATQNFFGCLDLNGIEYAAQTPVETNGVTEFPFVVYGTDTSIAESCREAELTYVELAYHMQPTAYAAREAEQARNKPILIACLREHGTTIDDDATVSDVQDALNILFYGADPAETNGEIVDGYVPVDCLQLTGIQTF
jgi:hypothetical protein